MKLMPPLQHKTLQRNTLPRLEGDWTLNTYIGDRIFQDRLHLQRDAQGELEGTLSVPNGFTAEVENLKEGDEGKFGFTIHPNEGNGAFEVNYTAEMDPKDEVFIGFARMADGNLIGGFVAQRPKAS